MTSAQRSGVALLTLCGALQVLYGAAAVLGLEALKESVEEIESNPNYGKLYFSLVMWGVLLLLAGAACLWSARLLRRDSPYARLAGLSAALVGLGLGFFTLAIFHEASLISVVVLLITLYVLSYRLEEPPEPPGAGPTSLLR